MATYRRNRASLASGALILALMIFTSIVEAQTNACCELSGETMIPRNGILDASLIGTVNQGKKLVAISIPKSEPNTWSRRINDKNVETCTVPGGECFKPVMGADNSIVVPKNEVALAQLEISSETPAKIRIGSTTVDLSSHFQSMAPAAPTLFVKLQGSTLLMCDDNSANATTHTWYFKLYVGGDWYDPQIENIGSGPPTPPPPLSRE